MEKYQGTEFQKTVSGQNTSTLIQLQLQML